MVSHRYSCEEDETSQPRHALAECFLGEAPEKQRAIGLGTCAGTRIGYRRSVEEKRVDALKEL